MIIVIVKRFFPKRLTVVKQDYFSQYVLNMFSFVLNRMEVMIRVINIELAS